MLSNLPRYQALVRYADRNERRQSLVLTFRERGQEDPTVAATIRAESEAYGMPSGDVMDYVNVILDNNDIILK